MSTSCWLLRVGLLPTAYLAYGVTGATDFATIDSLYRRVARRLTLEWLWHSRRLSCIKISAVPFTLAPYAYQAQHSWQAFWRRLKGRGLAANGAHVASRRAARLS